MKVFIDFMKSGNLFTTLFMGERLEMSMAQIMEQLPKGLNMLLGIKGMLDTNEPFNLRHFAKSIYTNTKSPEQTRQIPVQGEIFGPVCELGKRLAATNSKFIDLSDHVPIHFKKF